MTATASEKVLRAGAPAVFCSYFRGSSVKMLRFYGYVRTTSRQKIRLDTIRFKHNCRLAVPDLAFAVSTGSQTVNTYH